MKRWWLLDSHRHFYIRSGSAPVTNHPMLASSVDNIGDLLLGKSTPSRQLLRGYCVILQRQL